MAFRRAELNVGVEWSGVVLPSKLLEYGALIMHDEAEDRRDFSWWIEDHATRQFDDEIKRSLKDGAYACRQAADRLDDRLRRIRYHEERERQNTKPNLILNFFIASGLVLWIALIAKLLGIYD